MSNKRKRSYNFVETKELKKPSSGVNKNAVGINVAKVENEIIDDTNIFSGRMTEDSATDMVKYMRKIDPKLDGFSDTRKNAVLAHKRQITGKGAETEFIRDMFKCFPNFQNKLFQMLESIDSGYSVIENVWGERDGKFVIESPEPRHPGKFKFDEFGQTYLINEDSEKKVSSLKFPVMTYKEQYGNKYGNGKYQTLYWYWYIKKEAVKFWSIFTERFSVPLVIAEKPAQMDPDDEDAVDEFIEDIKAATSLSMPKDVVVRFLEADGQKSIDTFEKFLDFLDKSIAIAYLGQVDSSGVAKSSASLARAKVQNLVRLDIMLSDIWLLETFINDNIIKPAVDFNFNNVVDYPKWKIVLNSTVEAETIKLLIESGHTKIPIKWVSELFGIPLPDDTPEDEFLEITKSTNAFKETVYSEARERYIKEINLIMQDKAA